MQKFYLLIIKNKIDYDVNDDIAKLADWVKRKTGIDLQIDYVETDLDLKFKNFTDEGLLGLDGVKDQLRQAGVLPQAQYHHICFLYDLDMTNFDVSKLRSWTYPNPLNGSVFYEIPSTLFWEQVDALYRVFSHEMIHGWHRQCWWKGVATRDTMDMTRVVVDCSLPHDGMDPDGICFQNFPYFLEFNIEAPEGNRSINLAELAPHLGVLTEKPAQGKLLDLISFLLSLIGIQVARKMRPLPVPEPAVETVPMGSRIREWADAIILRENMAKYHAENHNGGALRWGPNQIGTIEGFAAYNTDADGDRDLMHQLTIIANGSSPAYNAEAKRLGLANSGELTLLQAMGIYAPADDGNDPESYALFIASRLGVSPQIKVRELLGI